MPKKIIEINDSTMLTRAVYDPDTEKLEVTFKSGGKTFIYQPVSLQMFGEFEKAQSRGSFFLRHIRNNGDLRSALVEAKRQHEAVQL